MKKLINHQKKIDTISLETALDADNFDLDIFIETIKPQKLTNTKVELLVYFSKPEYIKLLDKEILSKKTKAAQDKYLQMKKEGLAFITKNENAIYMTVASYINLQTAKKMVINQLARVNTLGTFLQTDEGFKVTAPEGFVAIKDGAALKLVDRLEFSRANFTIAKNWDKGDKRE